jgi:hypothetical protein
MSLTKLGSSIVMHQYGGPEVLKVERAPLTALEPGEIRIQAIASAINHSDLEIRSGNWPILKPDPFPYTPGLEVVGDVVEVGVGVQNLHSGDRVIAMMQGLGGVHARRPGGYGEYVTVRANTVAALDGDLAPLDRPRGRNCLRGATKAWHVQRSPYRHYRGGRRRRVRGSRLGKGRRRGSHRGHFPI